MTGPGGRDDAGRNSESASLNGFPLGRWAGVPVRAHWSVLFTLLLFAWLVAAALDVAHPRHSAAVYWAAGSATAAAFLLLLLAHELAHALVARHYRMPVRGVTLWMLGGATDLGGEPPGPRADAAIAAAGPLTSLVSGALALTAGTLLPAGIIAGALVWLGSVNILLGVFNLLPGAPLDGGRVLRAFVWARTKDRARADAVAARGGRVVGIAIIALGGVEMLLGDLLGIWLVLLGWFIMTAASGQQTASRAARIQNIHAGEVMTPVPFVAPDWWSVQQFLDGLPPDAAGQVIYPLVDFAGDAADVVTLQDVALVPPAQRGEQRLRDVAARRRFSALVVTDDADVGPIAAQLPRHGGIAVVTSLHRPVGVVTAANIARAAQLSELGWRPTTSGGVR